MLVLGIETSCDETSAAVVKNGRETLSNIVSSQQKIHSKFGGVIPEIASRKHLDKIQIVVDIALKEAKVSLNDINGVAVTYGPGLVGSLLVGIEFAKAIAFSMKIPLIGINHLEAHIYGACLEHNDLIPPCLCVIVSGGHTELIKWTGYNKYEVIAKTRDDAAGEAFDKIAKLLFLPYPGGPEIEKMASVSKCKSINFPKAVMKDKSMDFSFSGLKTAVSNFITENNKHKKADIANGVQRAIVDAIVDKALQAAINLKFNKVILAGGVASNKYLKNMLTSRCKKLNIKVYCPSNSLCTDNAAMVAAAGYYHLKYNQGSSWLLNAQPNLTIANSQ